MRVQVRCKTALLDSARCFVAQQPGTVSVWQGRDSTHREQCVALAAGRALAERLAEQPSPPPPPLPLAAAELVAAAADDDDDTATNSSLGHLRRLSLSAHAQAQAPVLLSGTTPQGVHLDKLGLFTATGEQHNNKPSFANERHAGLLLWWAEGKWWVGKREELGHGRGWIKAKSEAARPDTPGAGHEWLVYSKEARTWVVAGLACIDGGSLLPLTAATATVALTAAATALTAAATMPTAAPRPPPVALRWDVRVVREGSEPDDFWQALGDLSRHARAVSQPTDQGASTPLDAPLAVPPPPRLFLWPHAAPRPDAPVAAGAAAASELVESEVLSFSQASLEQDATFLLDAGSAVFAWVGAVAPPPEYGPEWLGQAAAAYARERAAVDGRDARCVVYTVHAGEEPSAFTSLFGAWSDEAAGRKEPPHEAARRLLLGAPSAVAAAAAVAAATGARSSTQAPRASMDHSSHSDAATRGGSAPAPADEPPPPVALRHLSSESPPRQSAPRSPPRCEGRLDHPEGRTAGPTASAEDGPALDHAAAGEVVLQQAAVGAYPAAASPSTPPHPLGVTGPASLPRRGSAERALPRSAASARRRTTEEAAERGSAGSMESAAPALPANVLSPGCVLSRAGSAAAATAPLPDASSPPKHQPARSPSTPSKTPTLNLSTLQLDARSSTATRSAEGEEALDSARRRAGAASAAAARLDGSGGAAYADPETARFGYREIRYEWRAHGVNPTCKELYLQDDEFAQLFGMGKAAFYAQRQWQQRDAKQKLHLF